MSQITNKFPTSGNSVVEVLTKGEFKLIIKPESNIIPNGKQIWKQKGESLWNHIVDRALKAEEEKAVEEFKEFTKKEQEEIISLFSRVHNPEQHSTKPNPRRSST